MISGESMYLADMTLKLSLLQRSTETMSTLSIKRSLLKRFKSLRLLRMKLLSNLSKESETLTTSIADINTMLIKVLM